MACLMHLQCSGCLPYLDQARSPGTVPAAKCFTQLRPLHRTNSGLQHASHPSSGRHLSVTAIPAAAEEPCLAGPPKRPRLSRGPAETEVRPRESPAALVMNEGLQQGLPPAPLTSAADRAPPPQQRVYWRGSVMSREAVLGRRLVASTGPFSVSAVLQGQMLSSKQITRSAPLLGWHKEIDPGIFPFTANLRAVYLFEYSHVHAQKYRLASPSQQPHANACQCRLLSWLGNEGHPERALEVFDWLERRKEYVTEDCHLYTRLVSMFARQQGGLATAMHIFDRMQARGIRPDTVAFNSAITAAGEPPASASCPRTFMSSAYEQPGHEEAQDAAAGTSLTCSCCVLSPHEAWTGLSQQRDFVCRESWGLAEGNEAGRGHAEQRCGARCVDIRLAHCCVPELRQPVEGCVGFLPRHAGQR